MTPREFVPSVGRNAREVPVRLLVVQGEARPAVDVADEPMVMTFPHLVVRELVAFVALSLALVLLSLVFDAPLEEVANPFKTPNPAKAPWYFLGLQELLHYYPPVVSGVLLPTVLIVALAVVPYFRINLERAPMWASGQRSKVLAVWLGVAALTALFYFSGAHPVWPLIVPMWLVAAAMTVGALVSGRGAVGAALQRRSMAFWIFDWFLLSALTLTAIGIFFRGPGWSLTLPWRDGIFY